MFDGESNAQGMSDSAYARKRRELLVLAHDLKALGYVPQLAPRPQRDLTGCLFSARAADLDVPRLVVIGAQSGNRPVVSAQARSVLSDLHAAGKSSLVEAVTGVSHSP